MKQYTDEDLTHIYKEANGRAEGKNPPITTKMIFTAMRAIAALQESQEKDDTGESK